jgi:hypothetical protein
MVKKMWNEASKGYVRLTLRSRVSTENLDLRSDWAVVLNLFKTATLF